MRVLRSHGLLHARQFIGHHHRDVPVRADGVVQQLPHKLFSLWDVLRLPEPVVVRVVRLFEHMRPRHCFGRDWRSFVCDVVLLVLRDAGGSVRQLHDVLRMQYVELWVRVVRIDGDLHGWAVDSAAYWQLRELGNVLLRVLLHDVQRVLHDVPELWLQLHLLR